MEAKNTAYNDKYNEYLTAKSNLAKAEANHAEAMKALSDYLYESTDKSETNKGETTESKPSDVKTTSDVPNTGVAIGNSVASISAMGAALAELGIVGAKRRKERK